MKSKQSVDVMKSRKRVLFLSINTDGKDVRDGLTYNFVTKEMERLSEKGDSIYFFSLALDEPEVDKGVVYDGGRFLYSVSVWQLLVTIFRWPRLTLSAMTIDWRRTMWSLKVDRAIYNMAKYYEVDVIHTHFFFPNGMAGIGASQSLKVPLLATMRGAELHNRPDLEYGACRDPLFRCFLRFSIPYCNRITAPNLGLAKRLIAEWPKVKGRVEYLPNGVDLQASNDRINNSVAEGGPLKIIAVGRLIRLKDHLTMVKAVDHANKRSSIEIRLTIVGNGPLSNEIKQYLYDNDCNSVELIDEISKPQLFELMGEHHLLLHGSLMEGMPNVILEALSLGVPCVASDIPGHREIIQQGVNGYLFPVSSVSDLLEILIDIVRNPEKIALMAPSCVTTVHSFLLDRKISRYQELYRFDALTKKNLDHRTIESTEEGVGHHGQ